MNIFKQPEEYHIFQHLPEQPEGFLEKFLKEKAGRGA
jgi:hypothetical protein